MKNIIALFVCIFIIQTSFSQESGKYLITKILLNDVNITNKKAKGKAILILWDYEAKTMLIDNADLFDKLIGTLRDAPYSEKDEAMKREFAEKGEWYSHKKFDYITKNYDGTEQPQKTGEIFVILWNKYGKSYLNMSLLIDEDHLLSYFGYRF